MAAAARSALAALSEFERGLAETGGGGQDGAPGGAAAKTRKDETASLYESLYASSLYERFVGDPEDMVQDPQGLRARL
jgi:hypothetical protein